MKPLLKEYRETRHKKSLLFMLAICAACSVAGVIMCYSLGWKLAGMAGASEGWRIASGWALAAPVAGWLGVRWWRGDF